MEGGAGTVARFARWASGSLARRMMLAALALSTAAALFVGALSFAVTWQVIRRNVDERLASDASRTSEGVALALDGVASDLARLSRNALMANALVDTQGRERYVAPFMHDFRLASGAALRLSLCDFLGRPIASNGARSASYAAAPWLRGVIDDARPYAALSPGGGELVLAHPVVYPSTGLAEGALVAEVELAAILASAPRSAEGIRWRLLDRSGRALHDSAASPAWTDLLAVTRPVAGPAPLAGLGLTVQAGVARTRILAPLARLAAGYLLGAALLLAGALWAARALALHVTRPLRALSVAAHEIASAGTFGRELPVAGRDETARLAAAFNDMLRRLRDATDARYAVQVAHAREAETALRGALQAMEQTGEPIAMLDAAGTFTYANRAASRLAGRGEGLAGTSAEELDLGRPAGWWGALWAELEARGTVVQQATLRRPSGPVEVEVTFSHFHLDERAHCVAILRDVTDRVRAQLVDRMASLGTLAAGVAHEINNPLAYVLSNVEYVARLLAAAGDGVAIAPRARAEMLAALSESTDGARRVSDIVRSLKRFSSPAEETRRPVDVRAELEASIALTRAQTKHRARLATRLAAVRRVLATEHELSQVFVNILVNAAQAIPEGHRDAHEIAVSCRMDGLDRVVVEIRDTGVGIAPEVRERIFEPFYTTKPVGVGTGLGLSICHGIVARLGGRIELESEVGEGSLFRVVLPAAAEAPAAAPPERTAARAARRRVLVVDDEAPVARALERMMTGTCDVVLALSAREALSLLDAGERFDAILCDVTMPEITGIQLYDELRARDEGLAARVAFMSGGLFSPTAKEFIERARRPVLEKPFTADDVRAAVAQILAGPADGGAS